jgi:hypothetical protein
MIDGLGEYVCPLLVVKRGELGLKKITMLGKPCLTVGDAATIMPRTMGTMFGFEKSQGKVLIALSNPSALASSQLCKPTIPWGIECGAR